MKIVADTNKKLVAVPIIIAYYLDKEAKQLSNQYMFIPTKGQIIEMIVKKAKPSVLHDSATIFIPDELYKLLTPNNEYINITIDKNIFSTLKKISRKHKRSIAHIVTNLVLMYHFSKYHSSKVKWR